MDSSLPHMRGVGTIITTNKKALWRESETLLRCKLFGASIYLRGINMTDLLGLQINSR
jgi:hypothetical protein